MPNWLIEYEAVYKHRVYIPDADERGEAVQRGDEKTNFDSLGGDGLLYTGVAIPRTVIKVPDEGSNDDF